MLLITGSSGLIGRALCRDLTLSGIRWKPFDIRKNSDHDTRDHDAVKRALKGVTGVVHLAAVSRVVWAQNDPATAREVNVDALENLIDCLADDESRPWLIFASSREVYGEQELLPVPEDATLMPLNVYAQTKVDGERLAEQAIAQGIRTQIVRFSNVYGSTDDHQDRVVPAFAKAAAAGGKLRIEGGDNTFDFTHVSDAARGLRLLLDATIQGEQLPPIHFLTGRGTTLTELAAIAMKHAHRPLSFEDLPGRAFDVSRFVGDPKRAFELLDWTAEIAVEQGFQALVEDFVAQAAPTREQVLAPKRQDSDASAASSL